MTSVKDLVLNSDNANSSRTSRAAALMIASAVNALLSLVLSMVAARVLTKTELAINSQTFLVYNTFASLLAMGIPSGIYYHLAHNENRKCAVVNEGVLLTFLSSMLFSVFILFGGNRVLADTFHNPEIAELLYYLIPFVLFMTPMSVLSCVFVYENRIRFNAVFSALQTFTTLVVVIAVMLVFRTGKSMVISRVLVSIAFAVIAAVLVYRVLLKGDSSSISLSCTKALLLISIPLGLSSLVSTLDRSLDKWIISAMLTPEAYAVYTQGARELPLISTFTGAISTVMLVDITKSAKDGDYKKAVALFKKIAEKTSILLLPLMMFFLVSANPFIRFLYTDAYIEATSVFQIYLLYLPIRTVMYGPLLIALGKSKFILLRSVIGLGLNALLSVLAVRCLGAQGAALATIITVYFFDVPMNLFVISKETGINWKDILPFKHFGICLLLSLPGVGLCIAARLLFTVSLMPILALIIEAVLFFACTGILLIWKFHLPIKDYCLAGIHKLANLLGIKKDNER